MRHHLYSRSFIQMYMTRQFLRPQTDIVIPCHKGWFQQIPLFTHVPSPDQNRMFRVHPKMDSKMNKIYSIPFSPGKNGQTSAPLASASRPRRTGSMMWCWEVVPSWESKVLMSFVAKSGGKRLGSAGIWISRAREVDPMACKWPSFCFSAARNGWIKW